MKTNIVVRSNLWDLEPGAHIFSAEFVSDNQGDRLEVNEFEFKKYLIRENNSDIEVNSDSMPAELRDIRFPNVPIKIDISHGFFETKEDAAGAFVDMINHIHKVVNDSWKKLKVNLNK
jgi:hypothetical protein